MDERRRPDPLRAALAGLAAGLVASFVMDRFQAVVSALSSNNGQSSEPSTEKAADRLAMATTGKPVPEEDKPLAGSMVHYAFGGALGTGYGFAAEYLPEVTAGFGSAFAVAVDALADEVAVPALRLGSPPWDTSAGEHAYGAVSHLVFGAALEGTRRLLRNAV